MDRYEELARQATWVASKVSSDVHGVDTMVGHLAEGRFKIGAGDTAVILEGILTPGKPLPGMVPVVTDNHLLLHDNTLYGDHGSRKWKEAYNHYVSLTKLGCIILAGTVENTFHLHRGCMVGSYVMALVALPDNQHALSSSDDKTVKLFNVNDGAVLRTFENHTDTAVSYTHLTLPTKRIV